MNQNLLTGLWWTKKHYCIKCYGIWNSSHNALFLSCLWNIKDESLILPHIHVSLSNFESVPNWRNKNKFWRVCMGCYETLIPYISIGNCNSELIFGMRASFRILYKNMTSYPIVSKNLFLWRHQFRTLCITILLWWEWLGSVKDWCWGNCGQSQGNFLHCRTEGLDLFL